MGIQNKLTENMSSQCFTQKTKGKQKDFAIKVYNECFLVQKNHKAKNTKSRVYGEVLQILKC